MNTDSISIISAHDLSLNEETKKSDFGDDNDNGIHVISQERTSCSSNYDCEEDSRETCLEQGEPHQSNIGIKETQDSDRQIELQKNNQETEFFLRYVDVGRFAITAFGIVAASVFCAFPWTTIQRTNSIIHQSWWMEILLPMATYWMLKAGAEILELTVWTKERSIKSIKVYFKMFLTYVIQFSLWYVSCYMIWHEHFGYNHPMPYLGMIVIPTYIIFVFELWIILPSSILAKKDFRRKLRIFMAHFVWASAIVLPIKEVLSYLFKNLPVEWQFSVAFMITAFREVDFYVRSLMLKKMTGDLDESSTALLTISVNIFMGVFLAIRLAGATLATLFCFVASDFFIHLKMTYQVINEHRKVSVQQIEQTTSKKSIYTTQLVLSELVEGFIPITYAACIVLALNGPNANILTNVGSTYWGKKIEDIGPLLITMGVLFVFDTISAVVTSIILWKVAYINMLQQFHDGICKYWLFFVIKLGINMSGYFATTDVNMGMDSTGQFTWITHEGRQYLINNSNGISDDEKLMSWTNTTLI